MSKLEQAAKKWGGLAAITDRWSIRMKMTDLPELKAETLEAICRRLKMDKLKFFPIVKPPGLPAWMNDKDNDDG